MPSQLTEFELISRFFKQIGPSNRSDVIIGVGDDCAIIEIPEDMSLCLSVDTMVEGIHFLKDCPPRNIASRAFGAALSDLAAMGADPSHFTLSLTLPKVNKDWLAEFAKGLSELADEYQVPLVGGDTAKGPLSITIQVHGLVPKGVALKRGGAMIDDWLVVTGNLGDAGAALQLLEHQHINQNQQFLLDSYYRPKPRFEQAFQLRGLASACIDISDGLLADAGHIAQGSSVELRIDIENLPLSKPLDTEFGSGAVELALSAGDDYELLFTISDVNWQKLIQQYPNHIYTRIGRVVSGEGVNVFRNENPISVSNRGFQHFE